MTDINTLLPYAFNVGDFVRCTYDYEITWWALTDEENLYHGVILDRSRRTQYFPYGTFYKVLCTDGGIRFFAEWEIENHPEA